MQIFQAVQLGLLTLITLASVVRIMQIISPKQCSLSPMTTCV